MCAGAEEELVNQTSEAMARLIVGKQVARSVYVRNEGRESHIQSKRMTPWTEPPPPHPKIPKEYSSSKTNGENYT